VRYRPSSSRTTTRSKAALRDEGRKAAAEVDHAAGELVAAHATWQGVEARMSALATVVRPVRPGDWVRARAERAAQAAAALLDQGGELMPDVRDPQTPRHAPPA
jgi:hypothetical protein